MRIKLWTFVISLITVSCVSAQISDTVSIQLDNGILEGTLSIADTNKLTPVVYIIAGSGPNDRDGNQPAAKSNAHLLLSDSLLSRGVSTLRVDKRMSGNSIVEMVSEEDMTFDYFVDDSKLWIDFLEKQNRFSDIIIIGHSQGSLVGILAAQNNNKVDAFISLAGPSGKVFEKLREQIYTQTPVFKTGLEPIFLKLEKGERVDSIPPFLNNLFRPSVQPFLISWDKYDPTEEIKKLEIPIAIIQGTTDFQVSVADAEQLKEAYPKAELMIIEGMNHVIKDAPADRMKNMKTYTDPDLPINSSITQHIVEFVRSLEK